MMKAIKIALTVTLIISNLCMAKTAKDQPLDLMHADKLLTSGEDKNSQTNLIGHVHLRHGTIELWSDRAVWYRKTDLVVFIDSVKLVDGPRILTCQNLTYYRKSGSATAVGDVKILDSSEQVKLTAGKVDYLKADDKFIATSGPEFMLYPADDSARTQIVGDSIIYNVEPKTGRAVNNVVITRRDIKATSDLAEFMDSGEKIKLSGNPKVAENDNLLEGDQIDLHTRKRTLEGMVVEGNARATYRKRKDTFAQDYTEAILEGKQLEVFFENDKLDKAVMRSNATSYYYPSKEDTIAKGRNVASGDSITLFFDNSEIYRVLIIGGAQGNYTEESVSDNGELKADTTFYEAQQIDYLARENQIELVDMGKLRYQGMALSSGYIHYNIQDQILIAEGLHVETDSGTVVEQTPVLSEGGEELLGKRMTYNMSTRKGKVEMGETEYDKAFFFGNELRQVEKDVLYVSSGKYIPCEDREGGVYFYSQKMKLINKDKVIGKPVILFLGPLPVFALPYYVFPIKRGRHSGILTFQIGDFIGGDRFIRNVGYYWAASDYWDAQASMDYYENRQIIFNGGLRYNVRYKLNGNVNTSFTRQTSWQNYERNVNLGWRVNFSHNQNLSQSMKLSGSGTFMSSKNYNVDNSYDQQDILNREIRSKMSFVKSWQNAYLQSFTAAVDQTWNLDTDAKTRVLPSLTFQTANIQLIPPHKKDITKRTLPWEEVEEYETHWYNDLKLAISSRFDNNERYFEKTIGDTSISDWKKYKTLQWSTNLYAKPKLFNILSVTPSFNIQQTFYKIDEIHQADTAYSDLKTNDYFRRDVWSASVGLSTVMYGTFYPNVIGVTGFRHTITPSMSYSYSPEITRNREYQAYTGVGSSSNRSRRVSLRLGNLFQMKVKSGEEEKGIDLFNLDFSTSYDFERESQRWGQLTSRLSSRAVPLININGSATHNFYDESTLEFRPLSPRLVNVSGNASFSRTFNLGGEGEVEADTSSVGGEEFEKDYPSIGGGRMPDFGRSGKTSLGVSLSYRYSESHSGGTVTNKTSYLECRFDLNLTSGWEINLNFNYDLINKQTITPTLRLSRDLNCWAGEFEWQPSGILAGYYFRIYLKQIPDIKVEQTTGRAGGKSVYR